jgi:hypothetical protein
MNRTSPEGRSALSLWSAAVLLAFSCGAAEARIVRMEVIERQPAFGGMAFGEVGPYEIIRGYAYGELDPADPHNSVIVDLELAPRNARGNVEYRTDIIVVRPRDANRGNGRLLFELNNRGDIVALSILNDGLRPGVLATSAGAGNGFIMRQGYTLVEVGWDATVAPGSGRLTLQAPPARQRDGSRIVGPVLEEFVIDTGDVGKGELTYPGASRDKARATLTRRTLYSDAPTTVPSSEWAYLDDRTIGLVPAGTPFQAGSLYEFTYEATDPIVVGVGLAAVRDVATHLRGAAADLTGAQVERIYTVGASQPIRFAHDFLALGFNEGEDGFRVFDGMLNYVGGASGGFFNYRFAQPAVTHRQRIGRWYPEFAFPFANQVLTDSVTGLTDGRMRRCLLSNTCPKVFEVNSENEYWAKAMSLLHTDTTGHDIPDAPDTRSYLLSNMPHSSVTQSSLCQQPPNPVRPGPSLRALLVALDQWVTRGTSPPPSQLPRVADVTLVTATSQEAVGFPPIPGVTWNGRLHTGDLLDFGPEWRLGVLTVLPPTLLGTPYPILVPKTDSDGHDLAGIRQVEVAVPTATYTGWGLRRGPAAGDGCDAIGQRIPLPSTRADRQRSGDPRLSLEERYPTDSIYVEQVRRAAQSLAERGFLLREDVERYIEQAQRAGAPR